LGSGEHVVFLIAWHVKRIKPSVFARVIDFDQRKILRASATGFLKRFTSYYDDSAALRYDQLSLISKHRYLQSLESTINQVLRNPSRMVQSLAESSFDAWIKILSTGRKRCQRCR
jgi:predicted metalloprotease with PDZ domain